MKMSAKSFSILAVGFYANKALADEAAQARRGLISAACSQENQALADALADAALKVEAECQPPDTGTAVALDYDTCSASEDFLAACAAAGGRQYKYDVAMACSQDGANSVTISASNVPECVGVSCEPAALEAEYGENGKVFQEVERQLTGFGFSCDISGGTSLPIDPTPPTSTPPNETPTTTDQGTAEDPTSEPLQDIFGTTSGAGTSGVINIPVLIGYPLLAAILSQLAGRGL